MGPILTITVDSDRLGEGLDAVRDAIADADAGLISLSPQRRTLEQVFLGGTP